MIDHNKINWPKVRPAGPIASWGGWPDDVREVLLRWNKGKDGHTLSFVGLSASWKVFVCARCEQFCEWQRNGTCRIDDDLYCDDCVIELVRESQG